MQSENRFFDDLAKMVNGIAGTVAGAGREAESAMRDRAKEWVGRMDFVSREEFEAVKKMAATARAEAEALKARLDKLEGVAKPAAAPKAAAAPKTAAKPAAAKPASNTGCGDLAPSKARLRRNAPAKPRSSMSTSVPRSRASQSSASPSRT